MAVDTMRVQLHLRLIRVLAVLVDTPSRFEVEVVSTRVVVALSVLWVQVPCGA